MKRRHAIIVLFVVVVILVVVFFPKSYARSGGFAGLGQNQVCACFGVAYLSYPAGCADCFTSHICAGIPYACYTVRTDMRPVP